MFLPAASTDTPSQKSLQDQCFLDKILFKVKQLSIVDNT